MPKTRNGKIALGLSLATAAFLLTNHEKVVSVAKSAVGKLPRGLRNNNPLNLRRGVAWPGLDPEGPSKDKDFDVFLTMDFGIRAALRNIQTAYTKHGCTTLRKLIYRWAPPKENKTEAYVATVAKAVPIAPDQKLPMDDRFTLARIIYAMAQHECGPDEVKKYLPFDQVHSVVKAYV